MPHTPKRPGRILRIRAVTAFSSRLLSFCPPFNSVQGRQKGHYLFAHCGSSRSAGLLRHPRFLTPPIGGLPTREEPFTFLLASLALRRSGPTPPSPQCTKLPLRPLRGPSCLF